ncbi:partner of Y14 and mago, partial [Lecanoromycetidae sp. Uapishka_2]
MPDSTSTFTTPSGISPSPSPIPRSGILTTPTGDRHIPQSTRADGSLRKEIKIRPGYRPPEDVEVYKNRTAEAFKTRGSGGIPGAEGLKDSNADEKLGGAAGKNAKRREARKKAKAAEGEEVPSETNGIVDKTQQTTAKSKAEALENWRAAAKNPDQELDAEAEKEKQARNLKKKLRQARELREKKDKGENLLPEQFEKVIKIQELIRQLDSLGFDAEGEKKPKAES